MHLSHSYQNASKLGCFIFLVGLTLSSISAWFVQTNNADIIEESLHAKSLEISDIVLNRFTLYQYGLRGVRGMISAAGEDMITEICFTVTV